LPVAILIVESGRIACGRYIAITIGINANAEAGCPISSAAIISAAIVATAIGRPAGIEPTANAPAVTTFSKSTPTTEVSRSGKRMSGIATVATVPLGKRCYRSEGRHAKDERYWSNYCLNEF
jgi:hypothetical protein